MEVGCITLSWFLDALLFWVCTLFFCSLPSILYSFCVFVLIKDHNMIKCFFLLMKHLSRPSTIHVLPLSITLYNLSMITTLMDVRLSFHDMSWHKIVLISKCTTLLSMYFVTSLLQTNEFICCIIHTTLNSK